MKTTTRKCHPSTLVIIVLFASLLVVTMAPARHNALAGPAAPDSLALSSTPNQAPPNQEQPLTPVGSGFSYQGQLKDGGNPANGPYDFTFKLYDASSGGTQAGSTLIMLNQTVSGGLFAVTLDFGAGAYQGQGRWLEVAVRVAGVGSYTTLSPRQALTAIPYASSLMPGTVITGTAGILVRAISSGSAIGLYGDSASGTALYGKSSTSYGVYGETSYTGGSRIAGVYGQSLGTNGFGVRGSSINSIGVFGESADGLTGVWGESDGALAYGVYGVAGGAGGTGVYGMANIGTDAVGVEGYSSTGTGVLGTTGAGIAGVHGTGGTYGVRGEATSGSGVYGSSSTNGNGVYGTSSNGYGVRGVSSSNWGVQGSGTSGVWGDSASGYGVAGSTGGGPTVAGVNGSSAGSNGIGVLGTAHNGSTALGVQGSSHTGRGVYGSTTTGVGVYGAIGTSGYAGYFVGNVEVTGACCGASRGTFRIDHPLDPENKYLVQSAVQSPDMKSVYDGNVITDGRGEAVVTLPDYFEALNGDFRYQLTVLDQFAQAIVAQQIKANRFTIKTDKPNVAVSWQVTGIRRDPYAKAHPIEVEVEKSASEKGKYLYPTEHGQPESKGIHYEEKQRITQGAPTHHVPKP